MKFDIIRAAKGMGARAVFLAKERSPELCFVGGVICILGAGYFTWNAKAKCEEVLKEHKENLERVKKTEEAVNSGEIDPEKYTSKMARADRRHYMMKTAVAFVKIFAPIVLLTLGGFTLFGKSTLIYKGRYLASAAICAEQNKYIKQLEEQIGEEKLKELSPKSPEDEGKPGVLKKPNEFWFDELSGNFIEGDGFANKNFLQMQEIFWDNKLQAEGAIFGNQVIKSLHLWTGSNKIRGTKKGQNCGWTLSKNPRDGAAGHISFGIDWENAPLEFFEKPVLIRLNWDATEIIDRAGLAA